MFERICLRVTAGSMLLAMGAAIVPAAAGAADANAPTRIVIGFAAGGSLDIVARTLADKLRASLGTTVLVENKPGASARLAAAWEVQGRYFIGLLSAATPMAHSALKVHAALEVPSRAHGVCPLADGSVVAVARRPGDWLVFGSETRGLAPELRDSFDLGQRVRLTMVPGQRSLNLSNAVAVTVFEAWRQNHFAMPDPSSGKTPA